MRITSFKHIHYGTVIPSEQNEASRALCASSRGSQEWAGRLASWEADALITQVHLPKHPNEGHGRDLCFLSSVLLLVPPTHSLAQALRWPLDIFWSCQGACNSEHGFLKMFKNLLRAVKTLAKTATEQQTGSCALQYFMANLLICWCISSLPEIKDSEIGLLYFRYKHCIGYGSIFFAQFQSQKKDSPNYYIYLFVQKYIIKEHLEYTNMSSPRSNKSVQMITRGFGLHSGYGRQGQTRGMYHHSSDKFSTSL